MREARIGRGVAGWEGVWLDGKGCGWMGRGVAGLEGVWLDGKGCGWIGRGVAGRRGDATCSVLTVSLSLNEYHTKCWEQVGPLLREKGNMKDYQWLQNQTRLLG